MSKEHAHAFAERMTSDAALRDAITAASEEVLNIAKANDLHFTREELASALADRWGAQADDDTIHPDSPFISERPGF